MGSGDDYECPDCGASFDFGEECCPECGVDIDWDDVEGVEIEREPVRLVDPRLPTVRDEVVPPEPVFSRWGLVFAVLTLLGFVATLLLMRWDTWVAGDAEDVIGDDQRTMIYAGAVATTAFAVLAVVDIVRGQSEAVSVPDGEP
jgi:hypothetical protein